MAMIYWQDKLVGLIAEAIRAICILGVPVSVIASFNLSDGTPAAFVCGLLLLSQIAINGLRSPPSR
jgi:hypothetical protein